MDLWQKKIQWFAGISVKFKLWNMINVIYITPMNDWIHGYSSGFCPTYKSYISPIYNWIRGLVAATKQMTTTRSATSEVAFPVMILWIAERWRWHLRRPINRCPWQCDLKEKRGTARNWKNGPFWWKQALTFACCFFSKCFRMGAIRIYCFI